CPYCRVCADPAVLRDHIDLAHAVSKTGRTPAVIKFEQYQRERSAAVRRKSFVKCPVCHSSIVRDRLNKHLWKVHWLRPLNASGQIPVKKRYSQVINGNEPQKSSLIKPRVKKPEVGSPKLRRE